MNTKNVSKTKISFLILLLHIVYATLFAVFMVITGLLEKPCNRDGIYGAFAMISIFLLCFFPFAATGINTTSIVFQILALRQNESKVKNIVMMAIAMSYEIAVIISSIFFLQGSV